MSNNDQQPECIFCNIIAKDMPSELVAENKHYIAIKDINPKAPVHILFLSKRHIASLNELTSEDVPFLEHVMLGIPRIAETYKMKESGYRVVSNIGEDGGQEIEHLHFHLLGGEKLGGMG